MLSQGGDIRLLLICDRRLSLLARTERRRGTVRVRVRFRARVRVRLKVQLKVRVR